MSARDDIANANLPITDPRHPFSLDRYRDMIAAEIQLGHMTVEAGQASGDLYMTRRGQMFLGQRYAVSDDENARIAAENEAMLARGRALR